MREVSGIPSPTSHLRAPLLGDAEELGQGDLPPLVVGRQPAVVAHLVYALGKACEDISLIHVDHFG